MDPTRDDPYTRLCNHYGPRLAQFDSDDKKDKIRDKQSRELVIQDFQNLNQNWNIEEFPGEYFPLDLSITQGYPDNEPGIRHHICLELKTAENGNTLKVLANGPSQGAFIPLHKIANLGTALDFVIAYDRAGLVYIIEGERYYIPYPALHSPKWLVQTNHPLGYTIYSRPADRTKFLKEGNLAIPIPLLQKWHGLTPFLNYIKTGWI